MMTTWIHLQFNKKSQGQNLDKPNWYLVIPIVRELLPKDKAMMPLEGYDWSPILNIRFLSQSLSQCLL